MEILMEFLIHCVVMLVLALALGWVIEQLTGEHKRKKLMREYWSLKSEMDNIERINRQLEDAAGSSKKEKGE